MSCFEKFEQFQFVEEKNRERAEGIMNEECLICKAPLTYLEADILMECEICHKKENSKTLRGQYSGRNGNYVRTIRPGAVLILGVLGIKLYTYEHS